MHLGEVTGLKVIRNNGNNNNNNIFIDHTNGMY